ncbi:MAG: hypothetical protein Q7R30_12580 [Acidobacteriota bacterium]|nr:hypothetical protein [Acidobacteriota bacterium]
MCDAKVWRRKDRFNLVRVVWTHEQGACARLGTIVRGKKQKLILCAVHARMFDEGLVKADGDTADPNTRRDLQRAAKYRRRRR